MKPRKLKRHIESELTAEGRMHLFKRLGFRINGHKANAKGWISGIEGPASLAEGKSDRFAVNLNTGAIRGHSSAGYAGDLWKCIGDVRGCGFRGALEWAAEELSIQSLDDKKWNPFGREAEQTGHYDYLDEEGKLLFQAVRIELTDEKHPDYPDKTFRQRTWNPKSQKWEWGAENVRQVPYQLPEVLDAVRRDQTVLIGEGEKVVHVLRQLGFTATCNPWGARKWRDEYSRYLEDATVVILPDNDRTGRNHAREVAESLCGVAEKVKIVELPGLPEKGDVANWLEQGGTREDLEQLINEAQPF